MGGRAKYKKNSCKGKFRENNSYTACSPEKMFLDTEKDIPAREMVTKKIRAAQKSPPPSPHHNFSYGPSLICSCSSQTDHASPVQKWPPPSQVVTMVCLS